MFSKEKLLRNLIILIIAMILGAILVALAIDSKETLFKKNKNKNNSNVMYANEVEV